MHYEPRNPEADAKWIESGGLKSWGCYAVGLFVLVLLLLYFVVHALMSTVWADPIALWASVGIVVAAAMGTISLWMRKRRSLKSAQERFWQEQIGQHKS